MKQGIILYSSSSLYLTFPQFKSIHQNLNEYIHVLLNVNEPLSIQLDNDYINDKPVMEIFDYYLKLPLKNSIPFKSFKEYWKYKKILIHFLYKINPGAVISGSDLAISDRVIASWCRKNNKPFIILQPSFIDGYPVKHGLKQILNYIILNRILKLPLFEKLNSYGNVSSKSYLFLWSKYFESNPKRGNTYFFGNPVFDNLFLNFKKHRKLKNVVLFCTDNLPSFIVGQDMIEKINNIFKMAIISKPNLKFIIKVHPREPIKFYLKEFSQEKYPNVTITKNGDLYKLFELSDIQISVVSFSSFEAAVVGLPIIMIRPAKIKVIDHFKQKIDIRVTSGKELVNAIDLCRSNEYWEHFLIKRVNYFKELLSYTDGQCNIRVANAIRSLISKKSS